MATRDTEFQISIGKAGRSDAPIQGSMHGAIGRAKRASGRSAATRAPNTGLKAHFHKGASKGAVKSHGFAGAGRRVIVKTRIVAHGVSGAAPLRAHVSYLARESERAAPGRSPELERQVDYLSREGSQGRAQYEFYNGDLEHVDAKTLTAGWSEDVRHFRLIISPEDGAALGDLKPFVREVMGDLETKLGTPLEWAAVDHWDTDNPHSHVLIRGRRAGGRDLTIPNRMLTQGIREHAGEIVTRVLGPRPALAREQAMAQAKEIASPALTPLDRELLNRARNGLLDVPEHGRTDLIGRLERLEIWGLAARHPHGRWALADDLKTNLEALGERIEINRMLERVEGLSLADFDILEADRAAPAIGRLVHVGMVDELSERSIAVIEDEHGHLRYAGLERTEDLAVLAGAVPCAIVEFEPRIPALKPADQAVARIAAETGGLYSPAHHADLELHADPALMAANVRRLEAMRRAGFVARRPDGVFEIAPDHQKRVLRYEAKRLARTPVQARIASYWPLGEQERATGLTHLDRVLAREENMPNGPGRFSQEFEAALNRRRLFLIEQGLMGERDMALSPDALDALATRELQATAQRVERQFGRAVLVHHGAHVEGIYAHRIDLAQGRFAVLFQRETAQLVPWRPALEQFQGQHVQGVVRGLSISWGLWRGRTPGLPPM